MEIRASSCALKGGAWLSGLFADHLPIAFWRGLFNYEMGFRFQITKKSGGGGFRTTQRQKVKPCKADRKGEAGFRNAYQRDTQNKDSQQV